MNTKRKQNGFSLIELLIVVAIILIIAAIAIPNLLQARIAANQASAVGSLRSINTAQVAYQSTYPTVGFAASLTVLSGTCNGTSPTSAGACLIDTGLGSGTKSGYSFALVNSGGPPATQYNVVASPVTPASSGNLFYCSVQDAVLRFSATAISTCAGTESPLQ